MSTPNQMDNPDKDFYDNVDQLNPKNLAQSIRLIASYFFSYQSLLRKHFHDREDIRILELGAGTCTLSALLSKEPYVRSILALDISIRKMHSLMEFTQQQIRGDVQKIQLAEGNISEAFSIDDGSFDLILFDASLHHSRSIWTTLLECRRVIRAGGMLVAQSEQFLGKLSHRRVLERLWRSSEVQAGVSENAYLKAQYEYYFRACRFSVRFRPFFENYLQRVLSPLNGHLFSKWIILAEPR